MEQDAQPASLREFVEAIRAGLVCGRCGRYVGSLAPERYLPPPYPIALDRVGVDDEAAALIGFEWHMLGLLRKGNFVLRHPERNGECVSFRQWLSDEDDEGEDEDHGDEEPQHAVQ